MIRGLGKQMADAFGAIDGSMDMFFAFHCFRGGKKLRREQGSKNIVILIDNYFLGLKIQQKGVLRFPPSQFHLETLVSFLPFESHREGCRV